MHQWFDYFVLYKPITCLFSFVFFEEPQRRPEKHGVHRRPARHDEVSLPIK